MKHLLILIAFCILIFPGKSQIKASPQILVDSGFKLNTNNKSTTFNPTKHGFAFENSFYNKVTHEIVTGGRCYGMVYTALDYFNKGKAIPRHDYRPGDNTSLSKYIYNRQIGAMTNIDVINKFSELGANPFGSRTTEFFNWGLQGFNGGRLEELRKSIDAGNPVPLGLYNYGSMSYDGAHHAVLAIGYEMGRYKGDLKNYKEDLRILIYDPNRPNQVRKMKPIPSKNYYVFEDEDWMSEQDRKKWMTYFVDNTYKSAQPPTVGQPRVYPNDNKIYEVLILTKTGGDDLRGGKDNVNVVMDFFQGGKKTYQNVNASERWVGGSINYVNLVLPKGLNENELRKVSLQTTFRGGMGGDNWDMDFVDIKVRKNNRLTSWRTIHCLYWDSAKWKCDEKPLMRFTGDKRQYDINATLPKPQVKLSSDANYTKNTNHQMKQLHIKVVSGFSELVEGNKLRAVVKFKNGTTQTVQLTNGQKIPRGTAVEKAVNMNGRKAGDVKSIRIEHVFGEGFLRLAHWRLSFVGVEYSLQGGHRFKKTLLKEGNNGTLHRFKFDDNSKSYTLW